MPNSKIYLQVPYAQKDAAKALGARWDPAKKQWYAPADKDITLFSEWQTQSAISKKTRPKSQLKKSTSGKSVVLGVKTYGKNKDQTTCTKDSPPWD